MFIMERVEAIPDDTWRERVRKDGPLAAVIIAVGVVLACYSQDVVKGLMLMGVVTCVLISYIFFPSSPTVGAFPAFWKAVNGVNLFYLLCLFAMAFQTREQTMDFIVTHIDPSLKLMNYEEVSYAEDCRMVNHDSPNPYSALYNACFDIFALAHFCGWFFKTLICRDLKLIMIASVSFEIIEYSLRNVLNNFKECWWDHVIIDIFGCNLLGIACAFVVIDKLGLDRYRWSLRSAPLQHSHWQNFKRFWMSWDISGLETKTFASLRPYLKFIGLLVVFQLNDLTLFFLKYIYQIPPPHIFCHLRMWVVGLLTINAVKQYYDFMRFRAKFRKVTLLLFFSIISMEIFITITHGKNEFDHAYIDDKGKFFLGGLFGIFFLFFVKIAISDILRKIKGYKQRQMSKKVVESEPEAVKQIHSEQMELVKED